VLLKTIQALNLQPDFIIALVSYLVNGLKTNTTLAWISMHIDNTSNQCQNKNDVQEYQKKDFALNM